MTQTQSEALTRRDALATGATVLGATTFGATRLSADAPKPRRKVRIGVVGGNFGAAFQWHQHPDCVVTGVTDLRADRRDVLRKVYKCDQAYDSMEAMLKQARDIDAVAIFTEAPNHVPHSVAALNAGKHVFCAVPAAQTLEECRLLIDTVKKTGLTYMMAETSYYQQETITARKWYQEGKFGDLFYCEAEYHHAGPLRPKPGSLAVDRAGKRTWRYEYPPMLYATHTNALLTGVTGERLVEVTCFGVESDVTRKRDNAYKNPFCNQTAMYKTSRGHGFRGSQYWLGAVSITVRASWYGLKMSFLAQTPYGQPPTRVTVRDKTGFDEAGYEFQEPLVEPVKVPKWYETDMLPKPLRHGEGGHDGSHPFLTHEFIDAVVSERRPAVDVYEAVAYTAPGIVAHQSALKGGELLKIPDFGRGA
jgi:predicted dehydrogenase